MCDERHAYMLHVHVHSACIFCICIYIYMILFLFTPVVAQTGAQPKSKPVNDAP